jgi:hypothetical protein
MEPTFLISGRKKVTDLTLRTTQLGNLLENWNISDEISLLDHRHICFKIMNVNTLHKDT